MSEGPDEQAGTRCGCVPLARGRGRAKMSKRAGSTLATGGGPGDGAVSGASIGDGSEAKAGASGARGRGKANSRGSRGSPTTGGTRAGTVGAAAASLGEISLEDKADGGRDGDRSYAPVYSPRAATAVPPPSSSGTGSGTPRYRPAGAGADAHAATSVPAEWRPSYEQARRAIVTESVRATVEWLLKRRYEVSHAERFAEVRAAVERRISDADTALRPAEATSTRDAARWVATVRALKENIPRTQHVAALAEECEAVLVKAMGEVVEPNLKALTDHLCQIAHEQVAQAAEALRAEPPPPGAAFDAAVHGKATAVHHVMSVALDDVQQQFVGGVADVCAVQLEKRLDDDQLAAAALVSGGVQVRRRAIEAPWRLSALIHALQAAAKPPQTSGVGALARGASGLLNALMAGGSGSGGSDGMGASASGASDSAGGSPYRPPSLLDARPGAHASVLLQLLHDEPLGWLREIVLALDDPTEALPMRPAGLGAFVLTFIATYLDPHIDGEKPPLSPAQLRGLGREGGLMARLRAAWDNGAGALAAASAAEQAASANSTAGSASAATPRGAPPSPRGAPAARTGGMAAEPFECDEALVIGAYIRHAIHKMNMTLGFGPHVPGVGRQPISTMAQQRHVKILAVAILEAVQRDFNNGDMVRLGELALTTDLLEGLIAEHLGIVFGAHADLNAALAIANKAGEDARKVERMRIWGYA